MQVVTYLGHCLKKVYLKKCAGTSRYKLLPKKEINEINTKEGKGYALPIYALSLQGLPFDNEENLLTFE